MNPATFLGLDKENQWRVSKDIAYSETLKTPSGLYKYVCKHFGLDTLKEAGKGRKTQRQREMYLMLAFELFDIPIGKRSAYLSMLGNIIGRDRATVHYQYETKYKGEYYSKGVDDYLIQGQRYMWHFYTILDAFKSTDYSEQVKELFIEEQPKLGNSLLSMKLLIDRKAILNFISMGYDYKDVNECFIGYTKTEAFKKAIKKYRPGLGRLIDYNVNKINNK